MIDVGEKPATPRRAVAEGRIRMSTEAFAAVRERTNPKGDVLALAEIAGIMAAKKTAELLPLCHPLPLDSVRVSCALEAETRSVLVTCEAVTTAKTGVEMEALCGVNGALLAIYDLSKAVDPVLTISDIRLRLKEGGKSGRWVHPGDPEPKKEEPALAGVRATVITVSDRASKSAQPDEYDSSGRALAERFASQGAQVARRLVPDDRTEISLAIREAAFGGAELVVLTGGTGLSPRDVTPEAVEETCERLIPGIGERLRAEGAKHTPMSWLSRSIAGQLGRALVIALPGSQRAVIEGADALASILPHALHVVRGGDHGHR